MPPSASDVHCAGGATLARGSRSTTSIRTCCSRVRALDYRFHASERLAVGAFFGAARLDLATPAYGYYLGGGVHFKELIARWDLGLELRFGDKVARDNVLPSDPQGGRPDNFYDLSGISVYLSRRF